MLNCSYYFLYAVSVIGWIVIVILVFGELRNFTTPIITDHMLVDKRLGDQLKININITFHALTCAQVHVDAMDVAGRCFLY